MPAGIRSADAGALGSASHLLQTDQLASPPAAAAAAPGSGSRQQQQQRQQLPPQRLLASTTSCPPGAPGGTVSAANGAAAAAAGGAAPDANASGSCVLSQPVNTSAVFSSSTQQLLSGCHSAPLAFLQPTNSMQQAVRNQVPLQRSCGCTGDEECEECEGVRVTLSSASNLPLVTTPGPRPKLLTLEDLNLAGEINGVQFGVMVVVTWSVRGSSCPVPSDLAPLVQQSCESMIWAAVCRLSLLLPSAIAMFRLQLFELAKLLQAHTLKSPLYCCFGAAFASQVFPGQLPCTQAA